MKNILYIIVAIVIFVLGYYIGNQGDPQVKVIKEIIPGDSIPYEVVKDSLIPVYHNTTVYDTLIKYDTVIMDIDTGAILRDYYSYRLYSDTVRDDTSMFVSIHDSVSQNRIMFRHVIMQNRRPTTINKSIVYTNGVYVGGQIGINSLGIGGIYIKNNNMFGIDLNLVSIQNNTKFVPSISYKRRLK